jgi:hypothetical protein
MLVFEDFAKINEKLTFVIPLIVKWVEKSNFFRNFTAVIAAYQHITAKTKRIHAIISESIIYVNFIKLSLIKVVNFDSRNKT